ncbi:hypothetical protein [Mycobacterium genavense]|uniref:hypothetical protein n=1 Tax=Mycobacterium genavense TaxID=36812 RepID=UPI001FDF2194|nr:hypothetical protein [Mycobacterium genavense]
MPLAEVGLRGGLLQHRHRRAEPPDTLGDGSDVFGVGGQHAHPGGAGDPFGG